MKTQTRIRGRPKPRPGAGRAAVPGPHIAVDVRALQDDNYATRGIGRHTMFVVSLLRQIEGVRLIPVGDPLLEPLLDEAAPLFDTPMQTMPELAGALYFNPSPLTHDTSLFVTALRRGMRCAALVHDFIPLRNADFRANEEAMAAYRYLVGSLGKYDLLVANSWFTAREIAAILPDHGGKVITVHCRSRFAASGGDDGAERPAIAALDDGEPFAFVATADDPRKNVDVALRAATQLRAMGLRLAIGGGFSEASRQRLIAAYPDQFFLAAPIFLPRLSDAELRHVYQSARFVVVGSEDEGFSLPVAEAIALARPVIASDIPAHAEQILDAALRFPPHDVRALLRAAAHVQARNDDAPAAAPSYRHFDYPSEAESLRAAVLAQCEAARRGAARDESVTIVGPSFNKATGIAVYNRLVLQECRAQRRACAYVDADAMTADEFYAWLFAQQEQDIVYIMGNNDLHHRRCFTALQNVPGACVMHDSRLFEFLLNIDGPHRLVELWNRRHKARPIDVATIVEWQRERRLLPYSFLDPLVARARHIMVHSQILAAHIVQTYKFDHVTYLPFALQMTAREVDQVKRLREGRRRAEGDTIHVVMLGETEATKGCCEIVFAVKMLRLIGLDAMLSFVGKSDEPFRTELEENARRLGIEEHVICMSYVTRHAYLDYMGSADVVVQLRYALFGQVSGPLGDAVACGVPVVTTADLAVGTGLAGHCLVIPNSFSPLHIADAIRTVIERESAFPPAGRINYMKDYVGRLFDVVHGPAAA